MRITSVKDEAKGIRTLFVEPYAGNWSGYVPGQFVMVWAPGVDEVPMSVSYLGGDPFRLGITVQDIGEATHALCSMEPGMRIGVRGPYGNGFDLDRPRDTTFVAVSGGVGAASVIMALEKAKKLSFRTVSMSGSRTADLVLFKDRLMACSDEALISTDDGTMGQKGFVTSILERTLKGIERPVLLVCGPEMMMRAVHEVASASEVPAQFSLERYMKCGIGVCDSCSVSGRRVCQDGPVFDSMEVRSMPDFGVSHRDRAGRSVPLRECVR